MNCGDCTGCLDRGPEPGTGTPTGCGGTCGCGGDCCAGVRAVTPLPIRNRPGLPQFAYRAGTFGTLLESMQARLASRPELAGYTTRASDDPGMALLDCWALVGDIVTFYGERAANEGFLGTATQPDSLNLLGRMVNYRPRPALGASGYLAFTMDPGAVGVIPAGTQARSVAGPNELPQAYETAEAIDARADWNQLAVRLTRPVALSAGTVDGYAQLVLVGSALNIQPGNRILVDFGSVAAPSVRIVIGATPDFAAGRTTVDLVPVGPVGLAAARAQLVRLMRAVRTSAPAGQVAAEVLAAFDDLDDADQFAALATLVRRLTEALVIVEGGTPPPVTRWLTRVAGLRDQAAVTLSLLAADQRRLAPDIAYLQELARALTCPPDDDAGEGRKRLDPGCDRAAPLAAVGAILPALRRPPSRPPTTATALVQTSSTALAPQSAAVTSLLAAADHRLAQLLGPALGNQTTTPPEPIADVIALRSKTNPLSVNVQERSVELDGTPDGLLPDSWLVTEQLLPDGTTATFANRIVSVQQYARTLNLPAGAPAATAPTTLVTVDGDPARRAGDVDPRRVTAYFGGIAVTLADEAIPDDVAGDTIALAQQYDGLQPGRRLMITGERTDIPGTPGILGTELTMLGGVEQRVDTELGGDRVLPTLVLATPLAYTYKRDTVVINGNVAAATQGESRSEVLGSGAAGQAGQAFTVRQVTAASALTFLPAGNALGAADTLTVRVDGAAWQETDELADADPKAQHYRVIPGSDGTLSVAFGDGVHGARLPTGQENVTAAYRLGGGAAGNVARGRITQLASHPLGVSAVTNPLATSGGADGDTPAQLRGRAPLRSLALDRLLSVEDYADFTGARAGIGQAAAALLTDGGRQLVHLTVAGVDDAPLDESDLLVTDLRAALAELGDPALPVTVAVRDLLLLVLSAGVHVQADHSFDMVEPAVRAAALQAASFERRRLGEPVYLSELVAAMQAVPGVDYVDVDVFTALPATADPLQLLTGLLALGGVQQAIPARPARYEHVVHTVGVDPTGADDTWTSIALRYGTTITELALLNPQPGPALTAGDQLTVSSGVRPAQLALLDPDVPQTLILRSLP